MMRILTFSEKLKLELRILRFKIYFKKKDVYIDILNISLFSLLAFFLTVKGISRQSDKHYIFFFLLVNLTLMTSVF